MVLPFCTAVDKKKPSCFEFMSQKLLDDKDPSLMYEIFPKKRQKNKKKYIVSKQQL